jgi:hypothetical protein
MRGVKSVHDVSTNADADVIRDCVNAEWRQHIVGPLDGEGV